MDTFDYDKEYKLQQELKSKDQQIKDLTELVEAANNLLGCVPISDHPFRNTYLTNFDEYLEKYQSVNKSYQQKYLTK